MLKAINGLIEIRNHEKIILEGARNSILDQNYINQSAKTVLQSLVPEQINVNDVEFHTENTDKGIVVSTNIDFVGVNRIYHKYLKMQITH